MSFHKKKEIKMNKTKLTKTIELLEQKRWTNENRSKRIKGVTLSNSDIDSAIMYLEVIRDYGTWEGVLMNPVGAVKEIIDKSL